MIVPLPLLALEKYENSNNEQDKEMKCLVETLNDVLPEYVGV